MLLCHEAAGTVNLDDDVCVCVCRPQMALLVVLQRLVVVERTRTTEAPPRIRFCPPCCSTCRRRRLRDCCSLLPSFVERRQAARADGRGYDRRPS